MLVEKITVPPDIRKGQPFDLRVVVNNTNETGTVAGRLRVLKRTNDQPVELSSEQVALSPGKNVFTIRQEIDQPDFYTYEAQFVPENVADDAMSQNNRATTFTHVRGSGHVLLIESLENRGEHAASGRAAAAEQPGSDGTARQPALPEHGRTAGLRHRDSGQRPAF